MNLIELHIIQSFPVTCLNRDDLGSPKSAVFGGVPRARVSSQCWKRAIREMAREYKPELFAGVRTRLVGPAVEKEARNLGAQGPVAQACARLVCQIIGKNKGDKTLLYFSLSHIRDIAKAVIEFGKLTEDNIALINSEDQAKAEKCIEKITKDSKDLGKLLKKLGNSVDDAADIALFGRMVADDSSQTVEGAAMFSHALSTHAVRNELDFFSAVDDGKGEADDAGAGHLGTTEFNSACYYRYIGVNLDLLRKSRFFNPAETRTVLENFIRASVMANPTARRNAMFGYTLPACVFGLRRCGQPLSLANAFEQPVKAGKDGIVIGSITALENEWNSLKATFGLQADKAVKVAKGAQTLDEMIVSLLDGIE